MTNSICDIFPFKQASISTNYHTFRDYQVTIVYCDVSRYCIQYKKSGTFELVPQSSYLSEQQHMYRSKAFTKSSKFTAISSYSLLLEHLFGKYLHLTTSPEPASLWNLFTKLVLHTRQFRLSKANSTNSVQHGSTTTGS